MTNNLTICPVMLFHEVNTQIQKLFSGVKLSHEVKSNCTFAENQSFICY